MVPIYGSSLSLVLWLLCHLTVLFAFAFHVSQFFIECWTLGVDQWFFFRPVVWALSWSTQELSWIWVLLLCLLSVHHRFQIALVARYCYLILKMEGRCWRIFLSIRGSPLVFSWPSIFAPQRVSYFTLLLFFHQQNSVL